jgi:hypothetical protein
MKKYIFLASFDIFGDPTAFFQGIFVSTQSGNHH